jgi:hypothetical protein
VTDIIIVKTMDEAIGKPAETSSHRNDAINWDQEGPHAFIQWKGTNVCADVYCACGNSAHFDVDFFYAVRCAACGAVYDVEPYVRLVLGKGDTPHVHVIEDDEE